MDNQNDHPKLNMTQEEMLNYTQTVQCLKCGHKWEANTILFEQRFCPNCNDEIITQYYSSMEETMWFCKNCGTDNRMSHRICKNCGAKRPF